MRYTSVGWTVVVPVSPRRRFGFFAWSRWRLPARERNTLPPAVILKRLATDFFVLIPLGRRIIQSNLLEKSAQYTDAGRWKQGVFSADLMEEITPSTVRSQCIRFPTPAAARLPAFGHAGGQTVFPAFGRVPRPGRKVVRLRCCTASNTPSCCNKQQCQKPISNTCFFHVSTPSKVPCGGLLVLRRG